MSRIPDMRGSRDDLTSTVIDDSADDGEEECSTAIIISRARSHVEGKERQTERSYNAGVGNGALSPCPSGGICHSAPARDFDNGEDGWRVRPARLDDSAALWRGKGKKPAPMLALFYPCGQGNMSMGMTMDFHVQQMAVHASPLLSLGLATSQGKTRTSQCNIRTCNSSLRDDVIDG